MFGSAPNGYLGMGDQSMMMPDPQPAQPKHGMFGGGNNWLSILAAGLSGYNARVSPQVNENIMGMIQAQQQQKAEAAQYEQRRQQALQDQQTLIDYRAAHAQPDDFTQRVTALNALKPGLGDTYAQNYASNGGGSMIQFVDPATGQRFAMPQPTAPTAPVGKLTPLGGSASGPSNFPR